MSVITMIPDVWGRRDGGSPLGLVQIIGIEKPVKLTSLVMKLSA